MNLAMEHAVLFYKNSALVFKPNITRIKVQQIPTSDYVLNEDWVFECQHNGDTHTEDVSTWYDPSETSPVTICNDCNFILKDSNIL